MAITYTSTSEMVSIDKNDPKVKLIYRAIQALAGTDYDGAEQKNDVGFNKMDSAFGRSLAEKEWEAWSIRMVAFAYKMIRKYRVQLLRIHKIDFNDIAVIPDPDEIAKPIQAPKGSPVKSFTPEQPVKDIYIDPESNEIVILFKGLSRPDWSNIYSAVKAAGAMFKPEDKTWRFAFNQSGSIAAVDVAMRFEFAASIEDQDKISAMAERGKILAEASVAHEADFDVDGLGGTLRPFQRAGVKFAWMTRRCIIADDMGLGKTIEAIATLQALQAFPALVVCPASLKINWLREIVKWIPDINAAILKNKFSILELQTLDAKICIINYENLMKNIDPLSSHPWKGIVFDEAHRLKTSKAQRSQAATMISYRTNEEVNWRTKPGELEKTAIPIRLALTGTPVQNRPGELLNLLKVIGRVHDVSPKGVTAFLKKYCGSYDGYGYNGASNTEELHKILRQTCLIRRLKTEVLKELPPIQRSIITFEIDNRKEYEEAEEDIISWVGQEEVRKARADEEFMQSIAHLTPDEQLDAIGARKEDAEERASRAERLVRIEKLKTLAARGKMKQINEWIEEFLETDEKLIVFANHIEIQKQLANHHKGSARIYSEDDAKERQVNIDRFQKDPACRTIMCSLIAGGEGITLTAASNIAFTELGWTPAAHDQAEARAHRMGQESTSVMAWYFIGKDTIEEHIAELLDKKRGIVNAVTDGRGMESNESLMEGIWEYLKKKTVKKQLL